MKTKIVLAIFIGLILGNVAVTSPAVVCTAFGTLTSNLSLCKPAQGEIPWDAAYNNNFDVLDALIGATGTPKFARLAVGTPLQGGYESVIGGSWTPTNAGQAAGLLVSTAVNAAANQNASIAIVSSPTGITTPATGTNLNLFGLWVDNLNIVSGGATITNAASFYVGNRPNLGTNKYVAWFAGAGGNRFDSDSTASEIILNRTAVGATAQIQFARSLVPGAYFGLSSTNDLAALDLNAVERLRLYTSTGGGLGIGTNPGDPGAGGLAMSGKFLLTQVTKPTCLDAVGANVCGSALTHGSDSALQFVITPGIAAGTRGLAVTFNVPFTQPPACVANWDGTLTYGYYVQAVTTSTTAATIRLGGDKTGPSPSWSPFDKGSLICPGVQ